MAANNFINSSEKLKSYENNRHFPTDWNAKTWLLRAFILKIQNFNAVTNAMKIIFNNEQRVWIMFEYFITLDLFAIWSDSNAYENVWFGSFAILF